MSIQRTSTFQKSLRAVASSASVGLLALTLVGCAGGSGSTSDTPADTTAAGDNSAQAGVGSGGSDSAATQPTGTSPTTRGAHAHCGWIGADTAEQGVASFTANADYFDAIHPKWFTLNADGSPRSIAFTDDRRVTDTAKAHHVKLIPLIDSSVSVSYLRTVLSSPANITKHAQQLAALVQQHGYDGIELDYEHLWSAADRAPYTQLVTEVGAALHAQGKELTLALPAMDHDNKESAYDYAALNPKVDAMHLMGYDFHYLGGDHLGPLAPMGWIDAVTARVATIGDKSKYILGVANYGIGPGWYGSVPEAIAKCGGAMQVQTEHMHSCPYGDRVAGRQPHCDAANIWFEDNGSIAEKVKSAKAQGLGGIGYWTVGSEQTGFFDTIKASYP